MVELLIVEVLILLTALTTGGGHEYQEGQSFVKWDIFQAS